MSGTHRDVLGFQYQSWNVAGGESYSDSAPNLTNQLFTEGFIGTHLQEQNHPLFSITVVLRDTKAVGNFLKGLNW